MDNPFKELIEHNLITSPYERKATELKKGFPDEAIATLRELETIEINRYHVSPQVTLNIRLRIVTILYEHRRFQAAEQMLEEEFKKAKAWTITSQDVEKANKLYQERLDSYKIGHGPILGWRLKRDIGENADFERNLYCKAIYTKFRILYEKQKKWDRALIYSMAEAYAQYENLVHNVVVDSPTPDFKAVKRILKKANSEEIFDGLNDIFNLYTKSLDSEQCWKMIAELERVLTYS